MGEIGAVPRILCVDDEPAMLAILSRALGARFDVVTQEDPVAALGLLERTGGFSVVISDMKMPQMDGADFLARVRSIAPACTRLALTACLERELSPQEVFGILTKPCPLKLLHESVTAAHHHSLLARREDAHRLAPMDLAGGLLPAQYPDALTGSGVRRRQDVGSDLLALAAAANGPSSSAPAGARLCLQILGKYVELGPRAILLGRSPDCQIVVNDPRILRRHVRFFKSWRGVTIQDLSATRDVRINAQCFMGVRHIRAGDWLSVGPIHAEVLAMHDVDASLSPVGSPGAHAVDDRPVDGGASTLAMLATIAEKFFQVGQGAEAERILQPALDELARRCQQGQAPPPKDAYMAVTLAARLAEETLSPRWIDYMFHVFTALRRPLGSTVVEHLHELMRRVPGASVSAFRAYLEVLEACQDRFNPAEQFLMRRIEGLKPLLSA
jgi:CheY-like chemotaxis protein